MRNSLLPRRWFAQPAALLPTDTLTYQGPLIARWLVMLYLVMITARSCVHIFAPDGGAHSIATIDISVAGGSNIVAIFGQWGAIQLLLACLLWVLLLRYRGLTALATATLFAEPFLRHLSGHLHPLETIGTAPGAALNIYGGILTGILFYLTLCPAQKDAPLTK
ncbi:MAG: hypothetical protein GC184_07240 [Rhizobiales bacterium]|nr:hypothetical protein [Hyphomicrobiales bacterium]